MKKNTKKLASLLCVGCIALSGCGDSEPKNNPEQENVTVAETDAQEYTPQTIDGESGEQTEDPSLKDIITDTAAAISSVTDTIAANNSTSDTAASNTNTANILSEPVIGTRQSVTGIITDASQSFIAFQTQDGKSHYLTIPDEGLEGGLRYITIGQFATINYIGSLDENHAILTSVTNSSLNTDIYLEEYAFAIKIINAVKAMDMEALSDLSNFPVFIDTGNYAGPMNTSGEFEAIENEKIFTSELLESMADYNLFDLKYTDAGFVMGTGPGITFDVDYDGILGIIGITSVSDANRDNTK